MKSDGKSPQFSQNGLFCGAGSSGQTVPTARRRLAGLCRSRRKQRQGVAAVEFAVVAPLFLLFVLGLLEYGRMVMVYQVLSNASRVGARIAVLEETSESGVRSQVTEYLTKAGVSAGTVTPWAEDQTTGEAKNFADLVQGDRVGVTISLQFDDVSWLPSPMFLGGKNLTATTQMRREGGG